MSRGKLRKIVVAVGVVGAALAMWASPAPAQPPDEQGWWWLAGATGVAPPGVPEDGLYVANNPTGTQGMAALKFTLAGGGSAGTLRLDLAGAPSGTPTIGLCQVDGDWEPAQGGSISDAPSCVESGATAAGSPSGDGQSYTFEVGALISGGLLNVAVIPGADSGTFSVAFKKPAADALTPAGTGDAGSGETTSPTPTAEPAPSFSPAPSYNSSSPAFEPLPIDAPPTGLPTAAAEGAGSGGTGLASPISRPQTDTGSTHGGWRIAGFVLLGLTAVAYHRLSITPDRAPRSLVSFGQLAAEEQTQG
jgi:hypothetical protein